MAGLVVAQSPARSLEPEGGLWPALREELRLYPGPTELGGGPTWTLYDPTAQRFFRLGWLEAEILNRWNLADPAAIAASICAETTLRPQPAMVDNLKKFLLANNLTAAAGPEDSKRLLEQSRRKASLALTAVKSYLFIRVPLLRPDAWLAKTLPRVRWLLSYRVLTGLVLGALLGFYLIGRQWSEFSASLTSLMNLEGGLLVLAAIILSKLFHELGHAYAAKALGLKVPSMGVALMCFTPVLWTDTTEAWKLAGRRERLLVGAAGVYAELILAVLAALAWTILPPGGLKTAAAVTAGTTWVMTLAININPCMRYDGYYLLSDYWEMPGLQNRSFALAKWRLREWLFGLGLPAPEIFNPRDGFKLVVYAYFTWIYRFFLFLGIALLVYHLFFKALGIILMLVELVFFIGLPVFREVKHWAGLRQEMRINFRLLRTLSLLLFLLFFFFFPWHGRVEGEALLFAERQTLFFAPQGAQVEELGAGNGEPAAAGQLLFRLRSPDLESRIELAGQKLAAQRLKLSVASLDAGLRAEMAADWEELERLAEDLGGLLARRAELEMRAPTDGRLGDVPVWLQPGSWVAAGEGLGILSGGGSLVAAYVPEADWSRLQPGGKGKFYALGPGWEALDLSIVSVDAQAVTEIRYPELASSLGGPLETHQDAQGRLRPGQAVYRVLCRVDDPAFGGRFVVGRVSLEAGRRSLAAAVWNNLLGLLVRESNW